MVKSRYIGDGHPTFNRNPYNGYINPTIGLMTIPYYMEIMGVYTLAHIILETFRITWRSLWRSDVILSSLRFLHDNWTFSPFRAILVQRWCFRNPAIKPVAFRSLPRWLFGDFCHPRCFQIYFFRNFHPDFLGKNIFSTSSWDLDQSQSWEQFSNSKWYCWWCWWFRNPAITSWYGKYTHIIYRVLAPSQMVVWDFFLQQYVIFF